jgi:hypothetical protein
MPSPPVTLCLGTTRAIVGVMMIEAHMMQGDNGLTSVTRGYYTTCILRTHRLPLGGQVYVSSVVNAETLHTWRQMSGFPHDLHHAS